MSVAAFTPVAGASQMPLGNNAHPLDPLSTEEIQNACELLKATKDLGAECRFAMVHLHEPPKAEVLAYQPGKTIERSAFLMVFNGKTGETHEAVVNLYKWDPGLLGAALHRNRSLWTASGFGRGLLQLRPHREGG